MFTNILLPTDGSQVSQKAVLTGIALAKSVGASVVALFAAPPATPVMYQDVRLVSYATLDEHSRKIKQTAAKHISYVERAARKAGVGWESVLLTSDFPEEDILRVAKKKRCDLIVMGTHGQRTMKSVFLGSVTQKVLANSKVPVLVVP